MFYCFDNAASINIIMIIYIINATRSVTIMFIP